MFGKISFPLCIVVRFRSCNVFFLNSGRLHSFSYSIFSVSVAGLFMCMSKKHTRRGELLCCMLFFLFFMGHILCFMFGGVFSLSSASFFPHILTFPVTPVRRLLHRPSSTQSAISFSSLLVSHPCFPTPC